MDIVEEAVTDDGTTVITHRWTGVLALIDLPTADHSRQRRMLALPPLGEVPQRTLPPPLLAPRATDRLTHQVGRVLRMWRQGNDIRACGDIDVEPDTPWGQRLLSGTPQPVGLTLNLGTGMVPRNLHWWDPILRALRLDRPPVLVAHDWTVRSIQLCDTAEWPDAFITLDALDALEDR